MHNNLFYLTILYQLTLFSIGDITEWFHLRKRLGRSHDLWYEIHCSLSTLNRHCTVHWLNTSWRNVIIEFQSLNTRVVRLVSETEAPGCSKTLVPIHQTTQCNIPEDIFIATAVTTHEYLDLRKWKWQDMGENCKMKYVLCITVTSSELNKHSLTEDVFENLFTYYTKEILCPPNKVYFKILTNWWIELWKLTCV